MLNIKKDLVNDTITNEVLVFAQYSKGKYKDVHYWDKKINKMISHRKSILKRHKRFRAYLRGQPLGELTIDEINMASFACDELLIGSNHENIILKAGKYKPYMLETLDNFNQNNEPRYKNTKLLAINRDSPSIHTQQRSKPISTKTSENLKKLIKKYVSNMLIKQNSKIIERDIRINTLLSYDFNGDHRIEYLVIAEGKNENTKQSGVFVLNIKEGKIISLLNESMKNRPDSYGNGYELLDAFDIDGDNILDSRQHLTIS